MKAILRIVSNRTNSFHQNMLQKISYVAVRLWATFCYVFGYKMSKIYVFRVKIIMFNIVTKQQRVCGGSMFQCEIKQNIHISIRFILFVQGS